MAYSMHRGKKKKQRMMANQFTPKARKRKAMAMAKGKKGAKSMSREDRIKMGEDALGDQPF